MGEKLKVPDLHSDQVQKSSDVELRSVIGKGKDKIKILEDVNHNVADLCHFGRSCSKSKSTKAATPEAPEAPDAQATTRLIVTANYDAGRTGLVYRDPVRRAAAQIRRLTRGFAPGWLAWLSMLIAWPLAISIAVLTLLILPRLTCSGVIVPAAFSRPRCSASS